jgi:hypothetical protein
MRAFLPKLTIGLIFSRGTSCRLALRISHPVKQDVNVEGTSQEANRCWDHFRVLAPPHLTHEFSGLPESSGLEELSRSRQPRAKITKHC